MIKKNKEIIKFIELVNNTFGENSPIINDHWEGDLQAIGFQKDDKLVYVCIYNKNQFFYECELLIENSDMPYIAQDSEDNVSEKRMLEVMGKFFSIRNKNSIKFMDSANKATKVVSKDKNNRLN